MKPVTKQRPGIEILARHSHQLARGRRAAIFAIFMLTVLPVVSPAQGFGQPGQQPAPGGDKPGFGQFGAQPSWDPNQAPEDRTDWMSYLMYGGGIAGVVLIVWFVKNKDQFEKTRKESKSTSDVIGGYRLVNLMMTGQSSQVWETVEVASGRHFAMKILLPEKSQEPDHREALFHEADVGVKLTHANVIRIVKLDKDHDPPYFVMEFFPAGNLETRILHKKKEFIKEKAHDIFRQTATALAYMNASGWVHRDVKPANIMVNSAGEVRLIDFALAQRIGKGGGLFTKKGKGKTAGTRSYMSPEQIRNEMLDGRADIYSFGATVYETVAGRTPFKAATPQDLLAKHITEKPVSPQTYNPEVTDEFSALVLKMLNKKKEDRPKDFHEVLMALKSMSVFKGEVRKKAPPA